MAGTGRSWSIPSASSPRSGRSLALCAHATSRIKLGTGVTNPITRHPSVTAAAAASLQLISGGRANRHRTGDSSLAYIGASPLRITEFERYVEILQTYLRGEEVAMEEASALLVDAKAGFDNLAIGSGPSGSSVKWLAGYGMPKVPVEAFATGPKAIAASARSADSIMLALSGVPDRVAWGVDLARSAAADAGRRVGVGCMLVVLPHEDVAVARDLARAQVATQARFAVMNHKVQGPATDKQAATLLKIAAVYDMNKHARARDGCCCRPGGCSVGGGRRRFRRPVRHRGDRGHVRRPAQRAGRSGRGPDELVGALRQECRQRSLIRPAGQGGPAPGPGGLGPARASKRGPRRGASGRPAWPRVITRDRAPAGRNHVRAIKALKPGGPEVLALVDVPDPVPGPGEVYITVKACTVNPTEP